MASHPHDDRIPNLFACLGAEAHDPAETRKAVAKITASWSARNPGASPDTSSNWGLRLARAHVLVAEQNWPVAASAWRSSSQRDVICDSSAVTRRSAISVRVGSRPMAFNILVNRPQASPQNGVPAVSSSRLGKSPTMKRGAFGLPAPKTGSTWTRRA
jgi:hypothetical protein